MTIEQMSKLTPSMNFPLYACAQIGSREYPRQMQVEVLRQADLPGQFLCLSADGTQLIVDQSRLALLWVKPYNPPTPNDTESPLQAS